jgi:serine/threonine protein kinase
MDRIPKIIGPFTIHEEIGRGGMSIVYRAVDSRNQEAVAVKILPLEFAHNPAYLSRFLREGENAVRLQHPNIVRVYEADQANGYHYIAMEWATGGTLSERIKTQQGPLPEAETVAILRQVAVALDYAHSLGFLHRDIKPSNIMFAGDGRAMLADFGVAKDMTSEHTMVTMPGFSVGTPAYMSPEQARGDLDIDRLGVVAYAALTGRMPFEADSQLVLLRKIVDEMPTPPEYVNPRIHPGAAYVLKCVLSKDPNARYSTAGEFVHALAHSLTLPLEPGPAAAMDATMPMIPSAPGRRSPTAPPSYGGYPLPPSQYAPIPPPGYTSIQPQPLARQRSTGWIAAAIALPLIAMLTFGVLNGNLPLNPGANGNSAPVTAPATREGDQATAVLTGPDRSGSEGGSSAQAPEATAEGSSATGQTTEAVAETPAPAEAIAVEVTAESETVESETAPPAEPAPPEAQSTPVTLVAPSAATVLEAPSVLFAWTSEYDLSPGQGLEMIVWPLNSGEDGWRQGRSPSGVRRVSAEPDMWRVNVDLATFARSQTDGFFSTGNYFWGIVLVEVDPYQRLSLLGDRRIFTYRPGQAAIAQVGEESICIGECDRD